MAQPTEAREVLIHGLRNAHAMEKQALAMMAPQIERIEQYPEVADRLRQHAAETEGQVQRLETALERLGDTPSALKDAALGFMGGMAVMGHTPAPDEILKNSFANFAFENYEIAAYNSLLVLADVAGETALLPVLQKNLEEEQNMAAWLESNLASVTDRYIALREAGAQAKH